MVDKLPPVAREFLVVCAEPTANVALPKIEKFWQRRIDHCKMCCRPRYGDDRCGRLHASSRFVKRRFPVRGCVKNAKGSDGCRPAIEAMVLVRIAVGHMGEVDRGECAEEGPHVRNKPTR